VAVFGLIRTLGVLLSLNAPRVNWSDSVWQ